MRFPIITSVLLAAASFSAQADLPCKESRTIEMALDRESISMLEIAIGAGELQLSGNDGQTASLEIQMCSSSTKRLDRMRATNTQRGSTEILELESGGNSSSFRAGLFSSANYGFFKVSGSIPASWGLGLKVGSGNAELENVASLTVTVGSGSVHAERILGHTTVNVGSGSAEFNHTHNIEIGAVGSGKLKAESVVGLVTVGSVGSGSIELDDVAQAVTVSSVGSGKVDIRKAGGDVRIGRIGSGSATLRDIDGNVVVQNKGSGSVRTNNVSGTVNIPD